MFFQQQQQVQKNVKFQKKQFSLTILSIDFCFLKLNTFSIFFQLDFFFVSPDFRPNKFSNFVRLSIFYFLSTFY